MTSSPWSNSNGSLVEYTPNFDHLGELFALPQQESKIASSGNWAVALDMWVADELRSAGFPPDDIWPRREAPSVLTRELSLLLAAAKPDLREEIRKLIAKTPSIAPRDARVLGKAYVKQVDVVLAQWSRGPELMVSTKTMMSSFRKNLPNRFEEAYGDAANLRGRYPLASIGFLFAMRASVLAEPGTLQRAADMLRKLRDPATYDSTGLVLVDYSDDPDDSDFPRILEDEVPQDLRTGQFFDNLVGRALDVAPVEMHVLVRENRSGSNLQLDDSVD
ncbi:MAG: hypothetical protein ABI632_04155 [Pseudolysinimonas sp.]